MSLEVFFLFAEKCSSTMETMDYFEYFGGNLWRSDFFSDLVQVLSIGRNPIQVLLSRSDPGFVNPIRSGPGFVNAHTSAPLRVYIV